MSNFAEGRLNFHDYLFRIAGAKFRDLERKVRQLGEDLARGDKPNPNDQGSNAPEIAYITTAINARTSNSPGVAGRARRCFLDPETNKFTYRPGLDPVTVVNWTGGTEVVNVYCVILRDPEGNWLWMAADCSVQTYNGARGAQPPVSQTVMTTQTGQTMTTQTGQSMTTF